MNKKISELWTMLLNAGLVDGSFTESTELESPWYVKTLLGISGWFAALFLFGFIGFGLLSIISNSIITSIIGIFLIGSAYFILRLPKNEFFEHLGLAISLAGQALILVVLFDSINIKSYFIPWILLFVLQTVLAIVTPNFVHRVFSSYFAAFALSMAFYSIHVNYIFSSVIVFISAFLWLNEFKYPVHIRKIQAIGYGLVLSLIPITYIAFFGDVFFGWKPQNAVIELWFKPWMAEVLSALVLLYVVWRLLLRTKQTISGNIAIATLAGSLILSLLSIEVSGIVSGVVIILLGFATSNRVLTGLGIIYLLYFIASYYYLLSTSLLDKSLTLLIVGITLIALRWIILNILIKNRSAVNE